MLKPCMWSCLDESDVSFFLSYFNTQWTANGFNWCSWNLLFRPVPFSLTSPSPTLCRDSINFASLCGGERSAGLQTSSCCRPTPPNYTLTSQLFSPLFFSLASLPQTGLSLSGIARHTWVHPGRPNPSETQSQWFILMLKRYSESFFFFLFSHLRDKSR